jgi:hypothetical protein
MNFHITTLRLKTLDDLNGLRGFYQITPRCSDSGQAPLHQNDNCILENCVRTFLSVVDCEKIYFCPNILYLIMIE